MISVEVFVKDLDTHTSSIIAFACVQLSHARPKVPSNSNFKPPEQAHSPKSSLFARTDTQTH